MTTIKVRDASLFVEVVGHGYPLLLMHGGPSLDLWSCAADAGDGRT
jgi:proline iminopeptidase